MEVHHPRVSLPAHLPPPSFEHHYRHAFTFQLHCLIPTGSSKGLLGECWLSHDSQQVGPLAPLLALNPLIAHEIWTC